MLCAVMHTKPQARVCTSSSYCHDVAGTSFSCRPYAKYHKASMQRPPVRPTSQYTTSLRQCFTLGRHVLDNMQFSVGRHFAFAKQSVPRKSQHLFGRDRPSSIVPGMQSMYCGPFLHQHRHAPSADRYKVSSSRCLSHVTEGTGPEASHYNTAQVTDWSWAMATRVHVVFCTHLPGRVKSPVDSCVVPCPWKAEPSPLHWCHVAIAREARGKLFHLMPL
jgi:hypothetical protein